MPAPDGPPALVLGSGVTALGVSRVLAGAGIRAFSSAERPENLCRSRHYRRAPGPPLRHGDDLTEWLRALPLSQAVLLPCADSLVRAVAALPADLASRFPSVVASPEVLDQVVDKAPFALALERAGVAGPFTLPVATAADLALVPEEVLLSAFLKPRDSQAFFARFDVKAFRVGSREEAEQRLAEATAAGLGMILQEYVPGPADAHYFVDGYVDRTGQVRGLFVRRRLRMHPPDFGNSSYMVSIAPEDAQGAVDSVRRLVASLGFIGIFSVELKRDARDGTWRVLELNARPWWYVEFAARCGVDVCTMTWRDALGLSVPDVTSYTVGRTLMYPPHDLGAMRILRRAGRLSLGRWLVQAARADQPVFRWSDPWPGLHEAGELAWYAAARRFRRAG